MKLTETQVLELPFDIARHKSVFINYLEVIIDPDGVIAYATPSHQEKLISLAMATRSLSRDELLKLCPSEYYGDFLTWLVQLTGCIPVWGKFCIGTPNQKQRAALRQLKMAGLYHGFCGSSPKQ